MFHRYEQANSRLQQALEHLKQAESVLTNTNTALEKKRARLEALNNAPVLNTIATVIQQTHKPAGQAPPVAARTAGATIMRT